MTGRLREVGTGIFIQTSDVYMTNTTVVTAGSRCLVLDPALLPTDLDALADGLRARGLTVEAAVSTHPHWDHLLWAAELGDAPRFASAKAIETVRMHRKRLLDDELGRMGERWYVRWDLAQAGRLTPIPQDGRVPWSGAASYLLIHDGHAPGHSAVSIPELGLLAAGDMLSDIEVPSIDWEAPDGLAAYEQGLTMLSEVRGVRLLIPGHGRAGDGHAFLERVAVDQRYLDGLRTGQPVADSRIEGWPGQRTQHQANVEASNSTTPKTPT